MELNVVGIHFMIIHNNVWDTIEPVSRSLRCRVRSFQFFILLFCLDEIRISEILGVFNASTTSTITPE